MLLPANKPKVSVIIPCYNAGEWIDEAVDSILSQTYKDYEIIIVNDGSSDPLTQEKLRSYESSSIQVIHQKNKGLAGARNTGIRSARGEYVLPLDADDMFAPTYLEKSVSIMERNPSIGVVTCWAEKFGEDQGTIGCKKTAEEWSVLIFNHTLVASLFRKACWREVGGYDEQIPSAEDWEFWIRILTTRWQRYVIEEPLFRYRVRSGSLYHGTSFSIHRAIKIYIYKKHRKLYKQYFEQRFWKAVRDILHVLRRSPSILDPKRDRKGYLIFLTLILRDNLHPLIYRGLRMAYRRAVRPMYRLLLSIKNKIKGGAPSRLPANKHNKQEVKRRAAGQILKEYDKKC